MKPDNTPTIRTIIFDLAEVYLRGLLGTHELLTERLGVAVAESDLRIPATKRLFEGKITEEDYWRAIVKTHGWDIDPDELKKIVRKNFAEIEGSRQIIEKLKKNGYKLGLLSVHAKEWIDHCEKEFDYHKLFDSRMYSFEVSLCKPEKKIYELMLKKLDAKSGECVFIDDHPPNLIPALELGMHTILFESSRQLLNELRSLGVAVA